VKHSQKYQEDETIYGDENDVYVKKIEPKKPENQENDASVTSDDAENEGVCKVLVISEGKGRKEKAINSKKTVKFLEGIQTLSESIKKGRIKVPEKVKKGLIRKKLRARQYQKNILSQ
jgi:hypothetical protein